MIYNVYNEVVCDYNCENCDIIESCTDKIESNSMGKYNKKVVERIKKIFAEYNVEDARGKDFYSYIASIVYNKPYEDCLEFYPEGTKLKVGNKEVIFIFSGLLSTLNNCLGLTIILKYLSIGIGS